MSGFSPDWLALREPADNAARATSVLARLEEIFRDRNDMAICDLGAGTGSSLRALHRYLPVSQHWHLIDNDPRNIDAARSELSRWADHAEEDEDCLLLSRDGQRITVRFAIADLAGDGEIIPAGFDLVTASALLDLTSSSWIERLAGRLSVERSALLAGLNYDGVMQFDPPLPLDEAVTAAFNRHQTRDKSFGPALGPEAWHRTATLLEENGFTVMTGDSPWKLDNRSPDLMRETLAGIVTAVRETGDVPEPRLASWADQVRARLIVGHRDLLALPPG